MRDVVPDSDVLAEELRAHAAVEKRTLVEDRHAGKIPEHEADNVKHSRGLENHRVLPCRNLARIRRVERLLRRSLRQPSGSRLATFGELAFCQPEESAPSMVMETSAEVCVCQLVNPRELKIPSTDSELEKIPAAVSSCFSATSTIFLTPSARSSG